MNTWNLFFPSTITGIWELILAPTSDKFLNHTQLPLRQAYLEMLSTFMRSYPYLPKPLLQAIFCGMDIIGTRGSKT